jgi:hypothetical protein
LQTILLGQPQLRRMMASPDLDQLRQRVIASYHLTGLTREETHEYVLHRLRAVGWLGRPGWDAEALDLVFRHSDGIPRRINRLCARILLSASLEEADQITAAMTEMTATELEEDLGGPTIAPAHASYEPMETQPASTSDMFERLTERADQNERALQEYAHRLGWVGRFCYGKSGKLRW